jgi:hypothetical protein
MKNKRISIILFTIVIILFIPLIAMQFTEEVNWTFSDFVVAGFLLFGFGFVCEIIFRNIKKINYRIFFFIVLTLLFLIIWADLAVGIFGLPFSGN